MTIVDDVCRVDALLPAMIKAGQPYFGKRLAKPLTVGIGKRDAEVRALMQGE